VFVQGGTYAGSPNNICGGVDDWGATDMKAWAALDPHEFI
jgi:hypothetical protein